jgi:hypothetical protein
MEDRSFQPNRPFTAAWPNAQSTRLLPANLAIVTAASPSSRNVGSSAAITDGCVLSRNAITTRNRDHANQATNNTRS